MKATILLCGFILTTITTINANPAPAIKDAVSISKVFNGFDAFHAHRQAEGVALAWTHTSASVVSFTIQHSWDGVTFETIDNVSPDSKGWNNYHDAGALPGFNYYRLGAVLSDGTTDWSDVECVRIVKKK